MPENKAASPGAKSKTKIPRELIRRSWGLPYTSQHYREERKKRKVKRQLGIAIPRKRRILTKEEEERLRRLKQRR